MSGIVDVVPLRKLRRELLHKGALIERSEFGALLPKLLGCVFGIVAVLSLRSARKVGLLMTLLVLLVPITALAGVPFIFANGTIADASQVNQNFAAVIPLVGRTKTATSFTIAGGGFVFPSSPTFVAPRDLRCVVTVAPYVVTNSTNAQIAWSPAIKIGAASSVGPGAGPGPLSLVQMPVGGFPSDLNYSGTFTEVFSVTNGSSISFGAHLPPLPALPRTRRR